LPKNCSKASKPPAEAPIHTIGNLPVVESEDFAFEVAINFVFGGFT